jgi:secondary thiamine-phosphate synthase enzyme
MMKLLQIRTQSRQELVDITGELHSEMRSSGVMSGLMVVYVPHTTAGVTINENADPSVRHDILADLDRLVPVSQSYYRHGEGNSAAHLKASLMGSSVMVIIDEGRMALGTWQGIYLTEFDGPRTRKIFIEFLNQ